MARYVNLDGTTPDKSLGDLVKWQIGDRVAGRRTRDPGGFVTPRRANDGSAVRATAPHLTWLGHSTYALRLGGMLVVTDPVLGERVGTIRRLAPPGVAFDDLPRVDVVTVSHSHYDHMDVPSLVRIARRDDALFVVPKDNAEVLARAGIARIVELGWWETYRAGALAITLVPSHHWSMRVPWDKNARLWGGFVIASEEGVAYHAGDTAFSAMVFEEIAKRIARIDWAMMPIGAYDPPWFMSAQHIGPEDTGRAWQILGARVLAAMHWGTFKLTDEPISEPPARLRAWWGERRHEADRLWIFDIGETRPL
jgi:L-ascorbate metabolism protein UlaG (beta-lactamase superfamily)